MDLKNLNKVNALIAKGTKAFYSGKDKEAIRYFDKAIMLNPNNSHAWEMRGRVFYELRKFNKALECLNKAIALDPKNVDAWYKKSRTLNKLGKKDEALACHLKTVEIDPEYEADPRGTIAAILESIEIEKKAEKYYKKYLKEEPF